MLLQGKPKWWMKLFERTNWKALWHHTIHCVTSQTSRGKPRGKLSMEGVQIFCQIFHILIKRQSHLFRSEGWAALVEREHQWKDEFYMKKRRGSSGESSGAKYSTIADCRRARLWNILSLSSASSPFFSNSLSLLLFLLSTRLCRLRRVLSWGFVWPHTVEWAQLVPSYKTFANLAETFRVSCLQWRIILSVAMKMRWKCLFCVNKVQNANKL